MSRRHLLIFDACVLIDLVEVDPTIITSVVAGIGAVHVASTVLAEVDGLDLSAALSLGIDVVEPPFEMLSQAAGRRGRLSFQDRVCLLLAIDRGWTCVSNDGALRKECAAQDVPVLWGLELLALLVERGEIPGSSAVGLAEAIARVNPFITRAVLERFRGRIAGR